MKYDELRKIYNEKIMELKKELNRYEIKLETLMEIESMEVKNNE